MTRLIILFSFIVVLTVLTGCDSPDPDETIVQLDGPILELQSRDGGLEFNGSVVNTANVPVKSVYVLIVLNDADGNIIETKSVLLDEDINDIMEPSEISFFTIVFDDVDTDRVFSKEVEIYYDPVEE